MSGQPLHYKLVLLGDTAVGKSCLVVRFVRNEFFEFQEPTIGAAFLTSTVDLDDTKVKFEIWDTAGQERYRSLAPMYYRGAAAAIVVYDITSKDSFAGAKTWVKELQREARQIASLLLLATNRSGGPTKSRQERGRRICRKRSYYTYGNIAKTSMNVRELFTAIAKRLPKEPKDAADTAGSVFDPSKTANKKKQGCVRACALCI